MKNYNSISGTINWKQSQAIILQFNIKVAIIYFPLKQQIVSEFMEHSVYNTPLLIIRLSV